MTCIGGVLNVTDGGGIDATWMGETLGKPAVSAIVRDFAGKQGGMSGAAFFIIDVTLKDGDESITIAVKSTPESNIGRARLFGQPREAYFFNELADRLNMDCVPKAYFAHGDMATGQKVILMENLCNGVNAGVLFGPEQPNNWGLKDELPALCEGNPGPLEISTASFSLYAQMHARLWKDPALLECSWLRQVDFLKGSGEESWQGSLKMAADAWKRLSAQRVEGTSTVKWDSHLVSCMDASFSKISWDAFQAEFPKRPWTLVHGDCHPHNAMWVNQRTDKAKLMLIDFEMVGIGSPSQELGQYLISHMTPEMRRANEKQLVSNYHKELIEGLRARGLQEEADSFVFEECWSEYVAGGAGRWAWFVPLLFEWCGVPMGQFFHDQVAEFLKDHIPDPSAAPMPRF